MNSQIQHVFIKIHTHLQLSAEIWLPAVCIQLYKKTRAMCV